MERKMKSFVLGKMKIQQVSLVVVCLALFSHSVLKGEGNYLLPIEAEGPGWNFNADLGWSYVEPSLNGDIWIWVPIIDFSTGRWIYTSKDSYPKFWDTYIDQWENINSCESFVYRRMSPYVMEMTEDYLTGNSFRSIEAYVQTEGIGIVYMKPSVSFLENNELRYSYSDTLGFGIWDYVRGRVLTDVRFIGDNLLYNPYSQILFLNYQKYKKL
jgi:hypothetical protein